MRVVPLDLHFGGGESIERLLGCKPFVRLPPDGPTHRSQEGMISGLTESKLQEEQSDKAGTVTHQRGSALSRVPWKVCIRGIASGELRTVFALVKARDVSYG